MNPVTKTCVMCGGVIRIDPETDEVAHLQAGTWWRHTAGRYVCASQRAAAIEDRLTQVIGALRCALNRIDAYELHEHNAERNDGSINNTRQRKGANMSAEHEIRLTLNEQFFEESLANELAGDVASTVFGAFCAAMNEPDEDTRSNRIRRLVDLITKHDAAQDWLAIADAVRKEMSE